MTPTLTPTATRTVPFRGRTTVLTLAAPGAIIAMALAFAFAWRASLPDPIAIHWGSNGPNGFGSFTPNVLWPEAAAAGSAILLWAIGFFAGYQTIMRRFVAGMAVWMATLFSGINLSILSLQRGIADAHDAGSITGPMTLVFAAATAGAIVAAVLSPADPPLPTTAPLSPSAPRLALRPGEHATWIRDVTARAYGSAIAAVVLLAALTGVLTREWAVAALMGVAFGFLLVMFLHWTVTVDATGLTVRPLIGRPRIRVPLNEVESAEAVTVRPIAEFGGFGIRGGKGGRIGVIVRKGEGLQVHRTGERVFVVTVDDAATGAALLNSLAARDRR